MKTIKGIFIAITIFFSLGAAVRGYREIWPRTERLASNATVISADDLHDGCTTGDVFNVSGVVSERHYSGADPIAEMKTKGSEFTVRFGFPEDEGGIYVGAHVVVQGTCYSSAPGLFTYLRDSKLVRR